MKPRTVVLTLAAVLLTSITLNRTSGARAAPFVAGGVPQAGTAVLLVASGFATQPGAANPLAGKPLVLFRESFGEFLKKQGMFQGPPGAQTKLPPLGVWAYACQTGSPVCKQALYDMQHNSAGEAKTDADGRATMPAVPPGTYYLFSLAPYNGKLLVWDLRVDLRAGANAITLDQQNSAPLDAEQARAKAAAGGAAQPAGGAPPANPGGATAAAPRPSGPKNSVLSLRAINDARQPIGRTHFYLLDEDFEGALKRAGFQHQMLLGKQLPLLNSFELVWRWKTMKESNPMFSLLEGMAGGSMLPPDVEEQYALGMKVLSEHTVATAKTDIYGKASFPAVPAGTYYVYGTANQFVKTGATGTVSGNTVTLNDTGYQAATIWNLKVAVRAGQNAVTLTSDNAAFAGQ